MFGKFKKIIIIKGKELAAYTDAELERFNKEKLMLMQYVDDFERHHVAGSDYTAHVAKIRAQFPNVSEVIMFDRVNAKAKLYGLAGVESLLSKPAPRAAPAPAATAPQKTITRTDKMADEKISEQKAEAQRLMDVGGYSWKEATKLAFNKEYAQNQDNMLYGFMLGEGHSKEEAQKNMDDYYFRSGRIGSYRPPQDRAA